MASLYKPKKTPYWYIRYNDPVKGSTDFSTRIKNKREAEEYYKIFKQKLQEQKFDVLKNETLLSTVLRQYFIARKSVGRQYNTGTQKTYERAMKYLIEACGDKDVKQYTKKDYYTFVEYLGERTNNTKSVYTRCMYALFNWLKKEEYIEKNNFERIREQTKKFDILTPEQVTQILDYAKKTKFYHAIRFMLITGFRVHEVCKLQKKDIQEDRIFVFGKGAKNSYIPKVTAVQLIFDEIDINNMLPDDYVFPISKHALWRFWQRMREVTGLNQFVIHDLRKYCLSHMANSGVNPYFLMNYARHTDIKTTLKYYLKADMQRMNEEIEQKVVFYKHSSQ